MRIVTTVLFLLCLFAQVNGQKTILAGKATDYSGKEITFYTIAEPVIRQRLELATTKIAEDGSFSVEFGVNETIEIYADLEKYCGTMVVETGKNYTIALPPFSLRTSNEAHSSYFKPTPYWFGTAGTEKDNLNNAIRSFETDFNREININAVQIYQKLSKTVVNEIIKRLELKYSSNHNTYFSTLKKYSFAELEYIVNQRTSENVIKKYFATQPIKLNHPVYQRAFETIFTDFLRKESLNLPNHKLINITNSGNYSDLVSFFENKGYITEFAELVVLKGLNDGYYTGTFSKEGVIKALEMARTATKTSILQPVVNEINNKILRLVVGVKAPPITLQNIKKETVTLDKFSGKFIYLCFFNSKSSDCMTELDSIVSIEKRLGQVLKVVAVALDDNFDNPSNLWKSKGYSWELLNGSKQKQLIINYNASITPAFYLIAPDGTLKLSQATSPSHGFEPLFLRILRDFNFKQPKPTNTKPVSKW